MKPMKDIPTPEMLLVEAQGAVERDAPIDLSNYAAVIGQLRGKNYSFGKIAEWLGERLGRSINKGGVFRVYEDWAEQQHDDGPPWGDFRPPDDEDEATRLIVEIAQSVREVADDAASSKSLPQYFAEEGILYAAKLIEQERADERAAEEADKAGEKKATDGNGESS